MGFPRTPTLDDFNRADENPLSNGGHWIVSPWWGSNPLKLAGHLVSLADEGLYGGMYWDGLVRSTPEVWVEVASPPVPPQAIVLELIRAGSASLATPDGLSVSWQGDGDCVLSRFDDGASTDLVVAARPRLAAGDGLGLAYSEPDGVVTVFHRSGATGAWTEVIVAADSTHAGPWYLQLACAVGTNPKIETFGGGDGVMANSGDRSQVKWALGNDSDDGDYTTPLVAAVTGKKLLVRSLVATVLTTAGVVTFKSGSTAKFAQHLALGTPLVLPDNPSGWFEVAAGEALTPNNASGVDSYCSVSYQEVEP